MTTEITLPISKDARDLLLKDIQGYSYQAQFSDDRAKEWFEKSTQMYAKGMDYLRDAEEFREKISDTLRIIELIDNHNLNFPSTESKEN